MFFHRQELQFDATPDKPDAVYARRLQEVLGGQYGEITVAMQYGFQAWNCHLPGKYRDLLYGIAAEEFGHVEMLAIMIARLHSMTDDAGVKSMLSFLIARDTMHQNQWIAAARELQEENREALPVPSTFPRSKEASEHAYEYLNFSDGQAAAEGSWASGPTPDGHGEFSYVDGPSSRVPMGPPTRPDPRFHGTDPGPAVLSKAEGAIRDALS
ncbi:manganese containing catalase [Microcella alkaliphila]|uniref:Manganese containing catalase n=1 Tax=Microcella alkaliphila TaxID=279828 RepID=A0A4Q7TUA5_9MICO|nr:manganese catalase family protein [Microcella alkaliphila]RZT64343.1 manganese containing catalase [Microcella alkaliphila]